MNFVTAYCPVRRDLEERGWNLTSRHALLTDRLISLIGHGHQAFLDLQDQCRTTSLQITDSRGKLHEHRREHGC